MFSFAGLCRTVAAIGLLAGAASAAPAAGGRPLLLRDAVAMAGSALGRAAGEGKAMAIVIVNREGRVILAQRMDGASFVSLDVAQGKAATAAALGVPTRLLEQQLRTGDVSALSVSGVIPIAGGVPLIVGGETIGAVGVSGGLPADDEAVAMAARDAYPRQ